MSSIYYSFVGTLFAFAFRDLLEVLWGMRHVKKVASKPIEAPRNLPKPKTANKSRVQR